MGDYLLDEVLKQFSTELGAILPDNDNYLPELPAISDPSTYEFDERCTNNSGSEVQDGNDGRSGRRVGLPALDAGCWRWPRAWWRRWWPGWF